MLDGIWWKHCVLYGEGSCSYYIRKSPFYPTKKKIFFIDDDDLDELYKICFLNGFINGSLSKEVVWRKFIFPFVDSFDLVY